MNKIHGFLPEYEIPVIEFHPYEYEENAPKLNSYREAINVFVGLHTGREFGQMYNDDVWNIRRNADISFCRFFDGEVEYTGRECMTRGLLSFDEAADMAYRAMEFPYYVRITFKFEDGRVVEGWHTETGKKQNEGRAIVKDVSHNRKQTKRNRRSNW